VVVWQGSEATEAPPCPRGDGQAMDRAGVAKLSRPEKEMRRRSEEGKAEAEAVRQEKGSDHHEKEKVRVT
jgi:hypothetical protein